MYYSRRVPSGTMQPTVLIDTLQNQLLTNLTLKPIKSTYDRNIIHLMEVGRPGLDAEVTGDVVDFSVTNFSCNCSRL